MNEELLPIPPAPKWVLLIAGIGCSVLGLFFSLFSLPTLVMARDKRDVQGGLAGTGICAILLLTGLAMIFGQKMPNSLRRVFHFVFGSLALLAGVGVLVWFVVVSLGMVETPKTWNPVRAIGAPFVFIAMGAYWLYRAIRPKTAV